MTHEHDAKGRIIRSWDDTGRLVYAIRANWGLEADRAVGRQTRIPVDYGDDMRRIYGAPKGGGLPTTDRWTR